jgi:hypothetical protein
LMGRRNRNGSAASSQPSSRSPNLALITTASSSLRAGRLRRRSGRFFLRRDFVGGVGQLGECGREVPSRDPATTLEHAAIGTQVAESFVEHQSPK